MRLVQHEPPRAEVTAEELEVLAKMVALALDPENIPETEYQTRTGFEREEAMTLLDRIERLRAQQARDFDVSLDEIVIMSQSSNEVLRGFPVADLAAAIGPESLAFALDDDLERIYRELTGSQTA